MEHDNNYLEGKYQEMILLHAHGVCGKQLWSQTAVIFLTLLSPRNNVGGDTTTLEGIL